MRSTARSWQLLKGLLHRGPFSLRHGWALLRILERGLGHAQTRATGSCMDAAGEPIPWFTYPAIEFLGQFDWGGKRVFEWGSGNSSLWFARRAGSVRSIEHDRVWADRTAQGAPANLS